MIARLYARLLGDRICCRSECVTADAVHHHRLCRRRA